MVTVILLLAQITAAEYKTRDEFTQCEFTEIGDIRNGRYVQFVCRNTTNTTNVTNITKEEELYYLCPGTTNQYYHKYYSNSCWKQKYSDRCTNDPRFYQSCGHDCSRSYKDAPGSTLCRSYVCGTVDKYGFEYRSGHQNAEYRCNGNQECNNTNLDEKACPAADSFACSEDRFKSRIRSDKQCNLECDCLFCSDEANCTGVVYGAWCGWKRGFYRTPNAVCDYGIHPEFCKSPEQPCSLFTACWNLEDEANCTEENTIRTCTSAFQSNSIPRFTFTRRLIAAHICAVPHISSPVCVDGLDQINCTDITRTVLTCPMGSYDTTVSRFGICKGYDLCDDGYQNECTEVEGGCVVHKNQICDGVEDCLAGGDESPHLCGNVAKVKCVRRVVVKGNGKPLPILKQWIFDGVVDCVDGSDESREAWLECGSPGEFVRYIDKTEDCSEVFICPQDRSFVNFAELCDKVESCGGGENQLCLETNELPTLRREVSQTRDNAKLLSHCLPGLEHLQRTVGLCVTLKSRTTKMEAFGLEPIYVTIPQDNRSCHHFYGENYVYLKCEGRCGDGDDSCPVPRLQDDSCINMPHRRIYTITKDNTLTVVYKSHTTYHNDLFVCRNKNCIPYSNVCDLSNDCGDNSDEDVCDNHFACGDSSSTLIPVSSYCDGRHDCRNSNDECGKDCDRPKEILNDQYLKWSSRILGTMAIGLNLLVMFRTFTEVACATTKSSLQNKSWIFFIAVGDLMMGIYLIGIAIMDIIFEREYCRQKYEWLSSGRCAMLGVISTFGSNLSLFSMTALSLNRYQKCRVLKPSSAPTYRVKLKLLVGVSVVILASLAISFFPLISQTEDMFVNGLVYHNNPLFNGIVDRKHHNRAFNVYFGRAFNERMSWRKIRRLVSEMFSQDYEGIRSKDIHFYGNSGVCLFKYLVTSHDPQLGFSLSVTIFNFCCFIVITLCYIFINTIASVVRYSVSQQDAPPVLSPPSTQQATTVASRSISIISNARRSFLKNRTLQSKISLIILTDFFCWIPFIIVCFLHLISVFDASPWYPFFSMVILPINSVINPLLYSDAVVKLMAKFSLRFQRRISQVNRTIVSLSKIHM